MTTAALDYVAAPRAWAPGTSCVAVAFNRGADARLDGRPLRANPYPNNGGRDEHWAWVDGWREADRYYGVGVRGRWPYRRLSEVQAG